MIQVVAQLLPGLDPALIEQWLAAVEHLDDSEIRALTSATRWAARYRHLADVDSSRWAEWLERDTHLPRDAVERAVERASTPDASDAALDVCARLMQLERDRRDLVDAADGAALRRVALAADSTTYAALDALDDLVDNELSARVRTAFPQVAALAVTHDAHAAVEHQPGASRSPLLSHTMRALERLDALRRADGPLDPSDALGDEWLTVARARVATIREAGLMPVVRAALIHLDIAKGGDEATRRRWERHGVHLGIHNEAAATVLRLEAVPLRIDWERRPTTAGWWPLVTALVAAHGLAGQALRGETPWSVLVGSSRAVSSAVGALSQNAVSNPPSPARIAASLLFAVNVADTAAVRDGLVDDSLCAGMVVLHDALAAVLDGEDTIDGLADAARAAHPAPGIDPGDDSLLDRLARLRRGRLDAGEDPSHLRRALLDDLSEDQRGILEARLKRTQLWYVESATGAFAPASQLKLLALGLGTDAAHVTFQPLLPSAHGGEGHRYRRRLIAVLLDGVSAAELLARGAAALPTGDLGTFDVDIGDDHAVAIGFRESAEASALLTLLPIYERRSSAAFHATLKALCDVYGLRKDEFDRVANEAQYLVHMNSARDDKARMVELCVPGTIVEVGPGGGVILDLLEDRFPDARIVGIDVSRMVVEALERRRKRDGRRWEIIEADAFDMPEIMGPASVDTVVYCSVLHEIFSYVPWPDADGRERPYRIGSVAALLAASWKTLKHGGRIVIRDGIAPPSRPVIVELQADDARESLELFAAEFDARPIRFEEVDGSDGRRVRMDVADAMEFLYCYTWGPESFPYEVREQYGVTTYDDYRDRILEWLAAADPESTPRWLPLPPELRSYLQPGYETGLAGRAAVFESDGTPARLPDSNCLLAFEKG